MTSFIDPIEDEETFFEDLRQEISLIGSLLVNTPKAMPLVEEILEPEHFINRLNAISYQEIRRLYYENGIADAFTLKRFLQNHPIAEGISIDEYLSKALNSTIAPMYAGQHARNIKDAWQRRKLENACIEITEKCNAPQDFSADQILEEMEEKLLEIAKSSNETSPNTSIGSAAEEAYQNAFEAFERGGYAGISSGYKEIDSLIGGLCDENLILLAARPGMGKTALGLGIGMRTASAGKRVLFWSGEMSAAQLGARAIAGKTFLPLSAVRSLRNMHGEQLHDSALQRYTSAISEARTFPIEFDTRSAITVAKLKSRARRMKRSKAGLDLIILDYIGLMSASTEAQKKGIYAALTEISADLKKLAKDLKIPVIALAQLNRNVEMRPDKRPMISDLRDSGALEQDADIIGLLYREEYYLRKEIEEGQGLKESNSDFALREIELNEKLENAKNKAELHIAKNRHGSEGSVKLQFTAQTTWFRGFCENSASDAWKGEE